MDYHCYGEDARADNRFEIRQARLSFSGNLNTRIRYRAILEFQGNDSKNIVDAYADIGKEPYPQLRIGQCKVPFGLETQTEDSALFYIERSMGYYLIPQRDVGLMIYGSALHKTISYALGIFNGDGRDGSSRGSMRDEPELASRLLLAPFGRTHWTWLQLWTIGYSMTYAHIDLTNVNLEVKSTGMAETEDALYVLQQNTKYGVLQGVEDRIRKALTMEKITNIMGVLTRLFAR